MSYAWLAIAIIAEVTATMTLNQSVHFTRPAPAIFTALCYAVAFYCLSLTLRELPTAIAYAIWSGAGIFLVASAAYAFQGQELSATAILGLVLIVVGIVILLCAESVSGA